jgi:hypothetical protein
MTEQFVKEIIFTIMTTDRMKSCNIEKYNIKEIKTLDELIKENVKYYDEWLKENQKICNEYMNCQDDDEKYEIIELLKEPLFVMFPIIECLYNEYNNKIEYIIKKFMLNK